MDRIDAAMVGRNTVLLIYSQTLTKTEKIDLQVWKHLYTSHLHSNKVQALSKKFSRFKITKSALSLTTFACGKFLVKFHPLD